MTITQKNSKYYCRFQLNGERHHFLCRGASNKAEAKKMENAFIYKLQQMQNGVIVKEAKQDITLKTLYDLFLEYSQNNKKSYDRDIHKAWYAVLKKAGISNFRFHDLRHTAATRMAECNIDLIVIKELLGHSKIETTMRYAHAVPKRKIDAIAVLNSYSEKLKNGHTMDTAKNKYENGQKQKQAVFMYSS